MMLGIDWNWKVLLAKLGVDVSRVHTLIPRVGSNGGFRHFCIFNPYLGEDEAIFLTCAYFSTGSGGNYQLVGFSDLNAHLER